jgi:MerR family redox-sensitive transcriptional activator SoxR
MASMTIGEVAKAAGLRTSAIRYYEEAGLLPRAVRVNGQRRYEREILRRLTVVRMAQEAGFTIEEIHTLLTGFPEGMSASARWRELAGRKLPEVDERIARLQVVRAVLEESLACGCLTLDACAEIGWRNATSES